MSKHLFILAIMALSTHFAHADDADAKARQQYMKEWRGLNKQMGDILKKSTAQTFPSQEFAQLAAQLKATADEPWQHYTAGSRGDATAAVWEQPQAFRAAIKQFNDAVTALDQAAKRHHYPAIQTAFGQVGQSCKSCHKQFKD